MTTIAWDGKTLAADRKAVLGGTPHPVVKIHRIKTPDRRTLLVGFSGDYTLATAWLRWMRGGEPPPTPNDLNTIGCMVIDEWRRIWLADGSRIYTQMTLPQWSMGSGCDYALAAMHLGCSAREAVEVASKLDNNSGMGVDVLAAAPITRRKS